jgi:hypothetical protein
VAAGAASPRGTGPDLGGGDLLSAGRLDAAGGQAGGATDGAGWPAFLRGLVARGLSGVQMVISDAHRGLVEAIGATLPGAAWQPAARTTCGTC